MNQVSPISPDNEPHAIEAEQQLLGAILLGHSTAGTQSHGGERIFWDPVHAEIYRICRSLESKDKPVTPVTVKASLPADLIERMGDLGGVGYLAQMAGASISTNLADSYAELLAEAKAKREIVEVMRTAQANLASGDMSASDIAARMETSLTALEPSQSAIQPVSAMKAVTEAIEDAYAVRSGEEASGVAAGIPSLGRIVPNFAKSELWLLGGRPSMGKSAVALSIGLEAARAGHPVIMASLEMAPRAMALRAISEATAGRPNTTSYSKIRAGEFSDAQGDAIKDAARRVAELPLMFLPREYQDVDLLQVGVRQSLRRMGGGKTPLVIVDYAQLMRSKARTRYEQITEISLTLKGMAMSLDVPVIALSQLSRALESRDDKRPMMSDLRESGQLEQDADGVIFCFREEYYLEREEPDMQDGEKHDLWRAAMEANRNKLELIVAKQRQGPIATAHVNFNPALNYIWEAGY